jgi:hypothetical protein
MHPICAGAFATDFYCLIGKSATHNVFLNRGPNMNTTAITAHSSSLFEIDAELEAAFDQMQEEREITGDISDESRQRCLQLFAELGRKIDRIAAYLRTQQRKANIAAEESQRLQQRRRSAEQRVDDVKEMLTYLTRQEAKHAPSVAQLPAAPLGVIRTLCRPRATQITVVSLAYSPPPARGTFLPNPLSRALKPRGAALRGS